MQSLPTRIAPSKNAKIGDLYNGYTDELCSICVLPSEVEPNGIKRNKLGKTSCVVKNATTFFDRCRAIGMDPEEMISTYFKKETFDGFAKFLDNNELDTSRPIFALIYEYQTMEETANILGCNIPMESIEQCPEATHVVSKIVRGFRAVILICAEETNERIQSAKKVMNCLLAAAEAILGSKEISEVRETGYSLDFHSDVVLDDLGQPTTLVECIRYLKGLPMLLEKNEVKDRQLSFHLFPVSVIQSLQGYETTQCLSCVEEQLLKKFEEDTLCLKTAVSQLQNLYRKVLINSELFPKDVEDSLSNINHETSDFNEKRNLKLWENIQAIRRDEKKSTDAFRKMCDDFSSKLKEIKESIKHFDYVDKKTQLFDKLYQKGVLIVSEEEVFRDAISSGEAFVLFHRACAADGQSVEAVKYFENLDTQTRRIYVDLDVADDELCNYRFGNGSVRFFKDGQCLIDDVVAHHHFLKKYNAARCEGEFEKTQPPSHRVILKMKCPNSEIKGSCPPVLRDWSCYSCETLIEYGSDGFFYCECGCCSPEEYSFFCGHKQHGNLFVLPDREKLHRELKEIPPSEEINILLIGETGSGKSTWINGVINYVSAKTLADAEKKELRYFIPAEFTMEDENKQVKKISIGHSDNEVFASGQSATQEPRSYTFNFGNNLIRFIDVPGIGDVRGADKDKENFDMILRYVQQIPDLHAICILITPNNARLTIALRYCLSELLTHLHSNAKSNIVFCFTKSRSTFYRAGETLKTLEGYLKDHNIDIPLNDETMFYFDNEAFRLLCAIANGVDFSEEDKASYSKSWDKSSSETIRLLQHAINSSPHKTREMASLNEIRRVIERLTPTLAQVSENIQLNIRLINDKEAESKLLVQNGEDLSSRLKITQTVLEQKKIDYPRTVCASPNCTSTATIPGTGNKQVLYEKICHNHCYLSNIQPNSYPQVGLKECWAMDDSGEHCTQCGCSWDVHLHIYYIQEQKAIEIEDKTTAELLKKNADAQAVLASHLKQLENKKEQLEKAYKKVTKYCACFGAFLHANSVMPYNDAMIEYLDYSIRLAKGTDDDGKVKRLEKFKKEYEEELKILKDESGKVKKDITLEEICAMRDDLFNSNDLGTDLKNVMELITKAEAQELKDYCSEAHQDIPRSQLRRFETSVGRGTRTLATSTDTLGNAVDNLDEQDCTNQTRQVLDKSNKELLNHTLSAISYHFRKHVARGHHLSLRRVIPYFFILLAGAVLRKLKLTLVVASCTESRHRLSSF